MDTDRSSETLNRILRWLPASGLVYFLIALFGLWCFADIAEDVASQDDITFYDVIIVNLLNASAQPALTQAFFGITFLGGYQGLSLLYLLAAGLLIWKQRWREAFLLSISTGGSWVLVDLAKGLFGRERPITNTPLLQEVGFSFPSGHSGVSMCFYGVFIYLILKSQQPWPLKALWVSVFIELIGLIGLSRVYLGVHYPSDVLGGFSLGLFWLCLCIALHEGQLRYFNQPPKRDASWNNESA